MGDSTTMLWAMAFICLGAGIAGEKYTSRVMAGILFASVIARWNPPRFG